MPISLNEFQRGNIIVGSNKIVPDFLRSHLDLAFTQGEKIKGVNPNPPQRVSFTFWPRWHLFNQKVSLKEEKSQRPMVRNSIMRRRVKSSTKISGI